MDSFPGLPRLVHVIILNTHCPPNPSDWGKRSEDKAINMDGLFTDWG